MKKILLVLVVCVFSSPLLAQKVDSIFFNLYTDSLKKGQHNYINVDGKMSNGRWMPLTTKEVQFSCTTADFEGNQLVIPSDFKEPKVMVRAFLKNNPAVFIEKTIWIKTKPDGALPSKDEILKSIPSKKNHK